MALANVALTDTFDYWRTVTNSMVVALNDKLVYCNTTNANTVSIPSFISRSSNLYVNIITSTSVYDTASGNVSSALSVNTVNELALAYASAANSNTRVSVTGANTWANTVGIAGNNYASILVANNSVGANNWANTKLSNTSGMVFNGRLGVNTAPTAFLSVYGNSSDLTNGVANFITPVGATGYNFIAVGRGISSTNSAMFGFSNTLPSRAYMGVWGSAIGSQTLNIDSSGNVTIPVTLTTGTLTSSILYAGSYHTVDVNGGIFRTGGGNYGIRVYPGGGTDPVASIIQFTNAAQNSQWAAIAANGQYVSLSSSTATPLWLGTNGSTRAVIDASGNMGIGTLTPAATLDVVGTVSIAKASVLSQTLTDAVTITWNTSLGQVATITLGGNRTMAAPTNLKVGTYILHVIQDGSGSRTITWNSIFKWPAGVAPVLTTTAGRRDLFSFVCDGTNLYGSYLPDVR
jgi:hypothetical protein